MEKIAILYICTGKYVVFWPNFFTSSERFLLPNLEKHYFVFTDSERIDQEKNPRVHRINQIALEWPYPTLYRYIFFKGIEQAIKDFDYIFFFNSNCRIVSSITDDMFLPKGDELVVTNHPYFWNKKNNKFTYERNPISSAYIPYGQGDIYAAGGLNGGRSASYLSYIDTCINYLKEDESKGIVPIWHDESYLNKFIIGRQTKVLHPGFLYPAGATMPFEKKIYLEEKSIYLSGYGKFETKSDIAVPFYKRIFGRKAKNGYS